MKIAVVANCQGQSLALCLEAMNPAVRAEPILFSRLARGELTTADLASHDLVFAQPLAMPLLADVAPARILQFPAIIFTGYHPDASYARVGSADGQAAPSPLDDYHSAIALLGWCCGMTVDEVMPLYRPEVFERLGYFDRWEASRQLLLEEGVCAGLRLDELFAGWVESRRCFMHTYTHPVIEVMADLARVLLRRAGLPVVHADPARFLEDPLRKRPVWPVYPGVAERLGLRGDYAFKPTGYPAMALREFVEASYRVYAHFEPHSLHPVDFDLDDYARRLGTIGLRAEGPLAAGRHPYHGLPDRQFWKPAVATPPREAVDPVFAPKFRIAPADKVATAGSCFAQHISRTLERHGCAFHVTERAAAGTSPEEAAARNYGVFSARYGNIYTPRQLLQLIQRATGEFRPRDSAWLRRDGRLVDPFRPQVEPEGFASEEALSAARAVHLAAVRELLATADVFVFTLGLTEAWRSRLDGAVFPLAPGVAGGTPDAEHYEFVNFDLHEVRDDLRAAIGRLAEINPRCRVLLTVSPVPLVATYERRHVLVSTVYSKSVLRAAAGEVARGYGHVDYFPSYELITGPQARGAYFEDDLREVSPTGVAHVMRLFMAHCVDGTPQEAVPGSTLAGSAPGTLEASIAGERRLYGIACDEEAIAAR